MVSLARMEMVLPKKFFHIQWYYGENAYGMYAMDAVKATISSVRFVVVVVDR